MSKELIIEEAKKQGITSPAQLAYILATAYWETNRTFSPVVEAYWLSEGWRKKNLRYYPYYGRGFVQLTWEKNYKKYSDILGKDLVKNPDLVLDPQVSAFILVHGMINGIFTGKKLSDYITDNNADYVNARKIINPGESLSKFKEVAKLAEMFYKEIKDKNLLGKTPNNFVKELQELINRYSDTPIPVDGFYSPKINDFLRKLV